ncbi:hypothetical protein LQ938_15290 [Microbacterium sp. cx-55]|uniref:hypothetical protein n=1 Tax=Microbacterium sp. cx-55 TaxID=2875948 RepID=UPI001CC176EA|nr:hypothetical protein [Microbacterium sp. cx-55]UGB35193.1 hypothetical protein LQ938_15290 [Microbacterium sp. cx-55]
MTPPSFDASALTAPVDKAAVRAFRASRPDAGGSVGRVLGIVFLVMVIGAFLLVSMPLLATAVISMVGGSDSAAALVPAVLMFGLVALGVVLAVRAFRNVGVRAYRLAMFARANGMSYAGTIPNPNLPGMIFSLGSSREARDAVRGEVPRFVEFANYRYTTGSGKNRTTHRWGYVAIKLDVPLPHIVLDALGNNGLFGSSNLPANFDADQRLSLEGDFDRYFALSCPEGYERDALYLFTPDIMARFIDNAAALDVEIVDDWLFLYGKRDFSTLDAATWAWLFSVVGALLDKLTQWSRWRDDHLAAATDATPDAATAASGSVAASVPFDPPAGSLRPPPGVAAGGRRLKRKVPWSAIVLLVIVGLMWVFFQSGIIGALLR